MNESQQGEAISFLHEKFANIIFVLHQLKEIRKAALIAKKYILKKLVSSQKCSSNFYNIYFFAFHILHNFLIGSHPNTLFSHLKFIKLTDET